MKYPQDEWNTKIGKVDGTGVAGFEIAASFLLTGMNQKGPDQENRHEYNGRQPEPVIKEGAQQTACSHGKIGKRDLFLERIPCGPADISGHLVGLEIMTEKSPHTTAANRKNQQPPQKRSRNRTIEKKNIAGRTTAATTVR